MRSCVLLAAIRRPLGSSTRVGQIIIELLACCCVSSVNGTVFEDTARGVP